MNNNVINPHDKLFKDIWTNKEEARDLLANYLPETVLELIDLDAMEISKDSFVEKELDEYFSDLLYKIDFKGDPGYLYLLFEHKSYKDRLIYIQVLEYMIKIWRLHEKQTKTRLLPIVIPLVFYHGETQWEIDPRFSSIFSGPVDALSEYLPDFRFILYDLTEVSDERIKGTIVNEAALLLLKYSRDPGLIKKLPGIFSLMNGLLKQENGLYYIEAFLRYVFSAVEDISEKEIKTILEKSLSDVKGDLTMTLAEQWRNEGIQQGIHLGKQEGIKQGIQQGIEVALTLKFGRHAESQKLIALIKKTNDINRLKTFNSAILDAEDISDLIKILR